MKALRKLLFKISRSNFGARIIGFCFTYLSWAMPVKRTGEDNLTIAFHHPKPISELHILVVPKRIIENIAKLYRPENILYRKGVSSALEAQYLANYATRNADLYFMVNGKSYQDVMQVHFHCILYAPGNEDSFAILSSTDEFHQRADYFLNNTRGIIFEGETMTSLLSNPELQTIIGHLYSDPGIEGFAMFSIVGAALTQQRAGFRWSQKAQELPNTRPVT